MRRFTQVVAAVLTSVLVVSGMTVPAQASPESVTLSRQREKLDRDGQPARGRANSTSPATSAKLSPPVWPAPGRATVTLPAIGGERRAAPARVKAGKLPVTVGRAPGATGADTSAVSVEVLDRAAAPQRWNNGLLLRLGATTEGSGADGATAAKRPGAVTVSVDYRAFRTAFGGYWSSRQRLWQVPDCGLQTPDRAGCGAQPLPSRNDGSSVSAEVSLGAGVAGRAGSAAPSLVALSAGASGPEGDFAATPMSASATWSAG
ncbi:hypothetical protein AB0N23_34185, partial [Streptomyces sp. NPDC052644]